MKLLTISKRWQKGIYAVSMRCFISFVNYAPALRGESQDILTILVNVMWWFRILSTRIPLRLKCWRPFLSALLKNNYLNLLIFSTAGTCFLIVCFVVVVVFCFRLTHQWQAEFLAILLQFVDSYCLIMLRNEAMYKKMNSTISCLKKCIS